MTATGKKELTRLELLPNERGAMITMSPPTTTVTFFRGSTTDAEQFFRERVAAIVKANPWLASKLEKDSSSGEMTAYYPVDSSNCVHFQKLEKQTFSINDTSYHSLVTGLGDVLCKTSKESLGSNTPLWQVSLITDANEPKDAFILVVSGNHSLMDGHDFYKIYGMLSNDAKIEALSPVRKQELPAKILQARGGEPSLMAASPAGFLMRFIGGVIRNSIFPETQSLGFYVDPDWIEKQKNSIKSNEHSEVSFLSSNDIIVSHFFQACDANCGSMAINFRGKIDECGETDVGNYEDLITYMPADFATPALIRQSIQGIPYRRAAKPSTKMLSNWQHLRARYGVITNWATFAKPIRLTNAQEVLHLPLFDFPKSTPASVLGSMVIFKPNPAKNEIACLCGGNQKTIDQIKAMGMVGRPLGIDI